MKVSLQIGYDTNCVLDFADASKIMELLGKGSFYETRYSGGSTQFVERPCTITIHTNVAPVITRADFDNESNED